MIAGEDCLAARTIQVPCIGRCEGEGTGMGNHSHPRPPMPIVLFSGILICLRFKGKCRLVGSPAHGLFWTISSSPSRSPPAPSVVAAPPLPPPRSLSLFVGVIACIRRSIAFFSESHYKQKRYSPKNSRSLSGTVNFESNWFG